MLYAVLSSFACSAYLFLGILILVFGEKTKTQKSFAFFCATLVFWSFASTGQQFFQDGRWASLFERMYFTGSELFILAGIIFALYLTDGWSSLLYRLIFLTIVVRMTLYQGLNWGYNLLAEDFPNEFWFVSHQLFSALESLFIPAIILLWGRKSSLHREKIQAKIIVISTIVGTIIGVLVDFLSGAKGKSPISCTIPLFWMISVCYAIMRYGLMRFTPAHINRELIKRMHRAVFLIDASWVITDLNDEAKRFIECDEGKKPPFSMKDIFLDFPAIKKRIEAVMNTETTAFSQTGFLRTFQGHTIPVVTSFSIINDDWGGRIGILGICSPQIDLHQFIHRYNLSERQTDILRHIISGSSQVQTAEALFISLATVKTHTTSLYNRLGISSRSELYALLQQESTPHIEKGKKFTSC